jgi:hypothetical protein
MLAVAIAAGAGVAIFARVRSDSEVSRENAAAAFENGPPTLLYADFNEAQDLRRLDLSTGREEEAGLVPHSGNTTAAPGSNWLAVEAPLEAPDGGRVPAVHLYDPETKQELTLSPALSPRWSPDGGLVAWLQPADSSDCGGSSCRGPKTLVVTVPDMERTDVLTAPGRFGLLGWAGDHVIFEEEEPFGPPVLRSVSLDGATQDLPLRPKEFWGGSPDGRYIVASGESGTRFIRMQDGQLSAGGPEIGISPGTMLGAGAWSHDSSKVAAFALTEENLDLVAFSPTDPEPRVLVGGGRASTGAVLWGPANDQLIFQRFTGTELEAVHCVLDEDGCDVRLAWTRGIGLLRIE